MSTEFDFWGLLKKKKKKESNPFTTYTGEQSLGDLEKSLGIESYTGYEVDPFTYNADYKGDYLGNDYLNIGQTKPTKKKESSLFSKGIEKTTDFLGDAGSAIGKAGKAVGDVGADVLGNTGAMGLLGGAASIGAQSMRNKHGFDSADPYKTVDKQKMTGAGVLEGAGKGASIGSNFGWIGTLVGGAVGALGGAFGGQKRAREEEKKQKLAVRDIDVATNAQKRSDLANKSAKFLSSFDRGGKFASVAYRYKPAEVNVNLVSKKAKKEPVFKFKRGGKLKETANIIPNGVSHEEKNKLGDKGMPVIKCNSNSCEKIYEIESDELILTLDITKEVENLSDDGAFEKLGGLLEKQLLKNTHSFTKSYEYINDI